MKEKLRNLISSKKFAIFLSFFGLFLLTSGGAWAIFSYISGGVGENGGKAGSFVQEPGIDPGLPKTEECPINGKLFSKPEREIWEVRRPIAVVIENHADSRPASGISKADVVYEAVSESGVTRFLGIFYCQAAGSDVKVAPVRSARVYFIDWVAEYGNKPIFMHVGGANDYAGFGETAKEARALELLETLGWRTPKGNDFDTTYDSGLPVFWRDYERLDRRVATEHTMTASLAAAYKEAEKRGFSQRDSKGKSWNESFEEWKFKDEAGNKTSNLEISFGFWSNAPQYDVSWKYDLEKSLYLRENGGISPIDKETGLPLTAKNVVILFAKEKASVDKNKHVLYTTIGKGNALVFQNGGVIEGTWRKDTRTSRTKFFDKKGAEIEFIRGTIWIEVVPDGNEVTY